MNELSRSKPRVIALTESYCFLGVNISRISRCIIARQPASRVRRRVSTAAGDSAVKALPLRDAR